MGVFSPFSFERGKGRGVFSPFEGGVSFLLFLLREGCGGVSFLLFLLREGGGGGGGGDFSPFSFQGGKEGRLFSFSVVRRHCSSSVSGAHSAKPRYPAAVNQYLELASRGDTIIMHLKGHQNTKTN